MNKIRILNQQEVSSLLNLSDAIVAVEKAYRQKATGNGSLWPMVFHEFDPGHADLDIKSGDLRADGIFGFKLVSWFEANSQNGLPELLGTSMLFDIHTGAPVALLNASALTGLRTGAAAAIGAKYLARPDAHTLLMAGTGSLAPYAIAATLLVCPNIHCVLLSNPHHPDKAKDRLADIRAQVNELLRNAGGKCEYEISAIEDLSQAAAQSDVIITATPSRIPFLHSEWIRPGTHISCLGADMTGKQELSSNLLKKAMLIADDRVQSLNVGESEMAVSAGIITPEHISGEIGDIISGKIPGRTNLEQITVLDSTGIVLQDLACCAEVLHKAEAAMVGTVIAL